MNSKTGFFGRWKNTIFSVTDHLWLLLLWAVSTPVFISTLGGETFGIWILINAVIGLGGVMSLGFGEATVRYVAKYRGTNKPEDIARIIRTTLALYVVAGTISAAGIALAAPWIIAVIFKVTDSAATAAAQALYLAGVALFVTSYLKTFEGVINGFERYDLTARVNMITRSFIILGNVALALSSFGLVALIACAVVGLTGQAITYYVLTRRHFVPEARLVTRPDWATTKEIASFGAQSWVQISSGVLSTLADRFLVSAFVDPAAAGVYSICLQLAQQIHLLLNRGLAFLVPSTSRDIDPEMRVAAYRSGTYLVLLLVGAVGLPLAVLAPQVLTLWVGPEFAMAGSQVLQIMTVTFSTIGAAVPAFFLLNGAGRPGWNTVTTLLYAASGLALAATLLPYFNLTGAAVARLASAFVFVLVLFAVHRFVLPRGSWRITALMIAWLVLLGAVAWGLGHGLGLSARDLGVFAFLGTASALGILGGALALCPFLMQRARRPVPSAK